MNPFYAFKKLRTAIVPLLLAMITPAITNAQVDYTIGTGTTANLYYTYPTPFGDYYEGTRAQFLFRASELIAAGMGPGVITALKWNVANKNNSGVHELFQVSIGTTTQPDLSAGYITGLTTVFSPTSYTPTNGMNVFTFPAPFVWNGTDNIVVQTCHGDPSNSVCCYCNPGIQFTENASVNATTLSFVGCRYVYQDCAGNLCNSTNVNTTTTRPNITFTFGVPCNGMPTTGISGPNEICPNKPFTLGFTQFYSGISVQWETSTNGGNTWSVFTGSVNSAGILTDAITVPTWYRCKVTCISSGLVYTTPVKFVNIAPFYYCYCDGSKATSTAAGMDVGNVTVITYPENATLLNNGTASPFLNNVNANKSYSDFRYSIPPVPMYHDSSYRLLVSQNSSSAAFTAGTAAVYIDFNRNGNFDAAERVLLGTTTQVPPTPGLLTDTVTVPNAAEFGITGMRVIIRSGTTPPDTCSSYTDGETEDYLVDLRYLPCDKVSTAGTVEGDTSVCTGYDYLLTDTTYQTKRYGLTKLWQISADGIGWSDIAGSAPKDTLARLFTGQPLFYRVREICTITNDTMFSAVHKVNLKAAYKCYCFSQAVGGSSLDSSDMGGFSIYGFSVNDGGTHLGNPRAVHKRQDFTDLQPIELLVDSIYQFHVFHTMPRDQHADAKVTMFMDFNNNHKYDIPQERVFTGFTNAGYHTIVNTVLILDSAIVNTPTGLRVVLNNDVSPNVPSDEACGTYTSGETEDYMVVFKRLFPVGVQDMKTGMEHMQLYPNPSNGKFTVRFYYAANSNVNIKVTTLTGQQVISRDFGHKGGWFTHELDMTGQPRGVYFVELDANGVKATKKLVIQ